MLWYQVIVIYQEEEVEHHPTVQVTRIHSKHLTQHDKQQTLAR